jgi:putative ABC transport system permease protein
MTRRSHLSTPGLITRHLTSNVAGSILVALLIAAAVLATALAPRALARLGTAELRHELPSDSPALLDLTGTGVIGFVEGLPGPVTVDDLVGQSEKAIAAIPGKLPSPLADHVGPTQWVANSDAGDGKLPNDLPLNLVVTLSFDLQWTDRITFVDGAAPEAWEGDEQIDPAQAGAPPVEQAPIPVALSQAAADELQLSVGDVIGFSPVDLVIAGIYTLNDPDDAYWVHESGLAKVSLERDPGQLTKARVSVYLDPLSLAGLQSTFASGSLSAFIQVDPSGLDYGDAATLQTQVRKAMAAQFALPFFGSLSFRSGLGDAIGRVVERVTAGSALLALSVSGLLGVLLAVFALAVQSVIARRRPALALAAARGAGALQLRSSMVLEGLLLSVPGAVAAVALAAVILPGPFTAAELVPPAVVAAAPAALFGVLTSPRRLRDPRGDLQVRSRSRFRWVAEVAVVALALLSLYLLARRGLVASSAVVGIDPLLAATPLLLPTAVCIGVLRLYPVPMLAIQRRLRARRGSAGVLGAARAVRDPALGFAAALALVVGITVVVFSTVMATTIRAGLVRGAQETVGADIRIDAQYLPDELIRQIAATDGVAGAVAVALVPGVDLSVDGTDTDVYVVMADTAALHEIRPDIPVLSEKIDGRIPVLVSSDWSDRVAGVELAFAGGRQTANVGIIPADAIPGATRHYVVIDSVFAAEAGTTASDPDKVLVGLDENASPAAIAPHLEELVTDAQPEELRGLVGVVTAQAELAKVRSSPTVASMESSLLLAAGASLLLTMLTVVLASVGAATARNRLVGVLRILGMSPRQLRAIQAWELGPVAVTAVLVGTGVGLVLPLIVTNVLDLRAFVGGRYQPGPIVDPLWIAAAVGSFVLVVVVAGIIAAAFGRRFAPAGTLKMGEG